jgi:hypothetical protein
MGRARWSLLVALLFVLVAVGRAADTISTCSAIVN